MAWESSQTCRIYERSTVSKLASNGAIKDGPYNNPVSGTFTPTAKQPSKRLHFAGTKAQEQQDVEQQTFDF